jgi:hypothetical protein
LRESAAVSSWRRSPNLDEVRDGMIWRVGVFAREDDARAAYVEQSSGDLET